MTNNYFAEVKKNFGFGCMRLPMNGKEVDYEETTKMIDTFMEKGFNYFDTAHGYIGGKSEIALRECLVKRYKREEYILVNKLTDCYFNSQEDIIPFFEEQLKWCGVDYFDFYLMHAQNEKNFKHYKKNNAYETAFELKEQGKIKHVGISFHDKADVLEQILQEYPQIEVVQIQLNYVDYEDAGIEGRKCYEICEKYGKPVIVMEPVKGGNLINLPKEAQEVLDELKGGSNASYAIRYAASFDNVIMVLSGMSNMEQMNDNLSYMTEFKPITEKEHEAILRVCDIFKAQNLIPCTDCKYCVAGCPMNIKIPAIFADLNSTKKYDNCDSRWYYMIHTQNAGKASDCIKCGQCEDACPQHLKITELLEEVKKEFEK